MDVTIHDRVLIALDVLDDDERQAVTETLRSLSAGPGSSAYPLERLLDGPRGVVYLVRATPTLFLFLRDAAGDRSALEMTDVVFKETLASYQAA